MAKGDQIKVLLDVGGGQTLEKTFTADKAGRSIEVNRNDRQGVYEIEVVGRAGTAARTVNLRIDRVILLEEVPA